MILQKIRCLALTGVIVVCAFPWTLQAQEIVIGANVQVSHDGDFPHIETPVAASPVDPRTIIAAGTAYMPGGRTHDRAYVTTDGGATWRTALFAAPMADGSGDPMVAVGATGTLYFATLDFSDGMLFYRSADSGRTWEAPAKVDPKIDHENIGVDLTAGKFAGRVYVAGESGPGVKVFHSSDDGQTFSPGVIACQRPDSSMANNGVLVLSDGTLFVSCMPYPNGAARRSFAEAELGYVLSTDGGETFAPFRTMARAPRLEPVTARAVATNVDLLAGNIAQVCAAAVRTVRYRDRIYCAWERIDPRTLIGRIYFAYSSDGGGTWSTARAIDATVPAWATQLQHALAVSRDGIVGVSWFDTRSSRARKRYDVYFTASRDGGVTFLPAVRVTTAPSTPAGSGNLRPAGLPSRDVAEGEGHTELSAYASRAAGGDYVGLAADAGGDFHPLWPDARDGTWQIYSTRIHVTLPGESLARGVPPAAERVRAPLVGKTSVQFEGETIDPTSLEVTLWGRIRNTSPDTLYGPFSVSVVGFWPREEIEMLRTSVSGDVHKLWPSPTVLNASNRAGGIGARFDYAHAAGSLDRLPPGAVTEALPWRFKVRYPRMAFINLVTTVTGYVRKSESR